MIDLIQVQDDLYGILMSAPQLATVNIVEERKSLLNSEIRIDAIWQTVRNGCSGNGLLIEVAGAAIMGVMGSPILGPSGNVEFLMRALAATPPGDSPWQALVDECVGALESPEGH